MINMINKIKFSPVNIEARKNFDFHAGDTIKVWSKIREEKVSPKKGKASVVKYRLQVFDGLVLARKHGTESGATFTVRKIASGVGVERIFPLYSPTVEKIEIIKRSRTRRAKLYFVRNKATKEIKRKVKSIMVEANNVKNKLIEAKTETPA
jgi:large subunit ribosomal protein L19